MAPVIARDGELDGQGSGLRALVEHNPQKRGTKSVPLFEDDFNCVLLKFIQSPWHGLLT